MDRTVLWRAVLVQAAGVAVLSLALGLALPHSFFENWGWVAGPGAWVVCALFTAYVLALPRPPALVGAALAGLPSVLFLLVGLHWLGAIVAVGVFGAWCARLGRAPRRRPTVS